MSMTRLGIEVEATRLDSTWPGGRAGAEKLTGTVRAVGVRPAWVELAEVNGNPGLRAIVLFDVLRGARVSMPALGSVIQVIVSEGPISSSSGTTLYVRSSGWFAISALQGSRD